MKKLIKSYNFWTSLAGAVGMLAVLVAKMFGKQLESKTVEELIMAVCGVLVVFGVVTKPKTKNTQTIETVELENETTIDENNENQNIDNSSKTISSEETIK